MATRCLAFSETCKKLNVPHSIERSRSGNGAHVWIFFTSNILASTARKLGVYLLTKTKERNGGFHLASFDRLFPNQDVLPEGGFGNLIALPLQKGPGKKGIAYLSMSILFLILTNGCIYRPFKK